MNAPKLSAIVGTYNHARFIRQALDGVLMQKADFAFEIVVGDDCSTDGTREIVLEYARAHPGLIRTVLPKSNLGDAGRALFVELLKHCRGRYLGMIDGDDYWISESKLQRQVDFLEAHPECSLCYHDAFIAHEDAAPDGTHFLPPRQPAYSTTRDLILSCCIPACSPVARREIFAELPPWFFEATFADVGIYLLAAEQGHLGYIDEPLGVYRVHGQGTWSRLSLEQQLRSAIELLDTLAAPFGQRYGATIAEARSWHHIELAAVLAREGRMREAVAQVGMAIRADPTLKRTWRLVLRGAFRRVRKAIAGSA